MEVFGAFSPKKQKTQVDICDRDTTYGAYTILFMTRARAEFYHLPDGASLVDTYHPVDRLLGHRTRVIGSSRRGLPDFISCLIFTKSPMILARYEFGSTSNSKNLVRVTHSLFELLVP